MSYLVLARKYRPRTFSEVAGQQVATRVLQGALREGRIGHAYLFFGPRGTGKTTSARIFAKALNCEQGPTPDPCGTCARCVGTDKGSEVDIIEIDAASNRGIDDARALRDEVAYAPMNARFKVYIVDEVHMLTKEAFNALLKTLEEPPPHVKFLFATTEPHKVIETIRSRCQMVQLSLIKEETISTRLAEILTLEGVQPEAGVVDELARQARGSMRDALSLTDQLLALVGDSPTVEDVRRLAGPASSDLIGTLVAQMRDHDQPGLLASLARLEGGDAEVCGALLEHLRLALIAVLAPEEAAMLVPDEARRTALVALAKALGPARVQLWLQQLLAARERMALLAEHGRIVLEVTLLDLAREDATMPLGELAGRLEALETRLGGAPPPSPAQPSPPQPSPPQPSPPQRESGEPAPSNPAKSNPATSEPATSEPGSASAGPGRRPGGPRSSDGPPPSTPGGPGPSASAPHGGGEPPASRTTEPRAQAAPTPTASDPSPGPRSSSGSPGARPAHGELRPTPPPASPEQPQRAGPRGASGQRTTRAGKTIDTGRVEWKGQRPPPPPADDDTFTQAVTDLFTGRIES